MKMKIDGIVFFFFTHWRLRSDPMVNGVKKSLLITANSCATDDDGFYFWGWKKVTGNKRQSSSNWERKNQRTRGIFIAKKERAKKNSMTQPTRRFHSRLCLPISFVNYLHNVNDNGAARFRSRNVGSCHLAAELRLYRSVTPTKECT